MLGGRTERAEGNDGRDAGLGIEADLGFDFEYVTDQVRRDHLRGGPAATTAPVHDDEVGGEACRLRQVMDHRDDSSIPLLDERAAEFEHVELVGQVEEGRGLVQQQQRRLLSEHHRDPYPLALPTGELVHRQRRELSHPGDRHRVRDSVIILF